MVVDEDIVEVIDVLMVDSKVVSIFKDDEVMIVYKIIIEGFIILELIFKDFF